MTAPAGFPRQPAALSRVWLRITAFVLFVACFALIGAALVEHAR